MTTTVSPETKFGALKLSEGDGITACVENGEIILVIHSVDEITDLEASFDKARTEPGLPLDEKYFDGLRKKYVSKS